MKKRPVNKNAAAFRSAFTDEQWAKEPAKVRERVERALGKKTKAAPGEPLWTEREKMKLGDGYSDHDKKRIREITVQLVEGMVLKGELDPDDRAALKKAVEQSARAARQAYNAALEYLCG